MIVFFDSNTYIKVVRSNVSRPLRANPARAGSTLFMSRRSSWVDARRSAWADALHGSTVLFIVSIVFIFILSRSVL